MGIGMMRRHYGNEEDSAAVHLDPQPILPDVEGGVVAIGDEPGTAPTPTVADATERNLDEAPASEDAPVAPDANEQAASEDQNGDSETTTDPEGHPPVHEVIAETLEDKGENHSEHDQIEEHTEESETAPEVPTGVDVERPKKNASRAVWAAYAAAVGVAVADTDGRDDIAARFLDEE